MRVLHVIPGVAPRYGGPSAAIFEICRSLANIGLEVMVASTDADGSGRLPVTLERTVDYQGVPAIFFPRQWSEAFKYSRPLAQWLRRHVADFDLVHIHAVFSHASLAAASSARRAGVPYVVRPLGSLNRWALGHKPLRKIIFWRAGVRTMLHRAQAIHYTSRLEQECAETGLGLRRGVVIPLGVAWPASCDLNDDAGERSSSNAPYVLVLGRLHPVKGLELLFDVFIEMVRGRFPEWKLKVVGEGEPAYVASLKQRVRELGGENVIHFIGWLDGAAKEAMLRGAQLLAMPSQQENFGMAAFESLAWGVPVLVSSQVDLAADIDAAGAGWVAPLNRRALSDALANALADDEGRADRGQAGQALVRQRFAWPVIAGRLNDLYLRLAMAR